MKLNAYFERAKEILLHPRETWTKIAEEQIGIKEIAYYVMIITVIPLIAIFIGYGFVGIPTLYGYSRMPLFSALFMGIVFYCLSLTGVALTALMIGFFSSYFSIEGDQNIYAKLAAYSATAPILAHVFYVIPILRFLKILGFYGSVLLFLGMPLLLKIPKDKEMQYVMTVVISAIVIALVFSGLTDQFLGPLYFEML